MKRRKERLAAAGLAAAMAAMLLAGCRAGGTKATPENLIRDMEKNSQAIESVLMNIKMEMEMAYDSQSMALRMDMDMESTSDPEASHGKGTVDIEISGTTLGTETEVYMVREDDEYITYTMLENQWTKETSDVEAMTGDLEEITGSMEDYADQFDLNAELVDVNGKECFELNGELDGDIFAEIMDTDLLDSLGEYGTAAEAIESLTFPCTIDIYRDSILPARLSFDIGDTLAPMVEEAGIELPACYIEITFTEYDSVDAIEVPEDVISQAEDASGDDGGLLDLDGGGAGVTPAEPAEQNVDLGDDWESYTVQINDTVVTLPCTIAELEAAGVTMDREYTPEDYVVNSGEYELAWFVDVSGNEIMADMVNTTDSPIELKDCLVGGVTVYSYNVEYGGLTVIFPGGIQIGSAQDDVLAAYGDADDVYEDEEYGNSYYWYAQDSYFNGCTIDTEAGTGLVQSMSLDHME